MGPIAPLHLRALVFAGTHLVFSALLGAALLALTVADVLMTASEAPPPGWLGALYLLLSILNAPMAGFFGLWQDPHPFHLPLLLLATAWSLTLGYLISLAWLGVSKAVTTRHENPATKA
jgi:hypothetical protein